MVRRFPPAIRGVRLALRRPEVALHGIFGMVAVLAGVLGCLDGSRWAILTLTIGAVLAAEIMNTALEGLADALSLDRRAGIRRAKDISAAAVLVLSVAALGVGGAILLPPWIFGTAGSCLP